MAVDDGSLELRERALKLAIMAYPRAQSGYLLKVADRFAVYLAEGEHDD